MWLEKPSERIWLEGQNMAIEAAKIYLYTTPKDICYNLELLEWSYLLGSNNLN